MVINIINVSILKSKEKLQEEKKILLNAVVLAELPGTIYSVEFSHNLTDKASGETRTIKRNINCSVSGRLKKRFYQFQKGDEVKIEISISNIETGVIVQKISKRKLEGIS